MRSLSRWTFDPMASWQRQRKISGKMWVGTVLGPFPANLGVRSSMDILIAPEGIRQCSGACATCRRVGDDVLVTNTAGKPLHFRVTHIAYYAPDQAPIQDIFGNLGGTYLNLITCAGDWIPSQHQTTLRLAVYTTLA